MTPVSKHVLEVLSTGIRAEVAAYVFYKEAAKMKSMGPLREMLEKLALEEKGHFQILETQHHSLVRSEQWVSTADALKAEGLPDTEEDMAVQHRELIDKVHASDDMGELLDIAYQLEKDANELYAREAAQIDAPEGRKMFEELAKFEAGHMALIAEWQKKYVK